MVTRFPYMIKKLPLLNLLNYLFQLELEPQALSQMSIDVPKSEISTRARRKRKRKLNQTAIDSISFTKNKRQRISTGSTTVKQCIREIKRYSQGNPILPLQVKGATISSLGTIVWDKPAFHARNYIWPVGFKRKMPSINNPKIHED
jgi:hypothetical protein